VNDPAHDASERSRLIERLNSDARTLDDNVTAATCLPCSDGLTDQTLSCTAKAHVPKPERHAACLHVRRAMQAACRRASCAAEGGSAAGPKPGRVGFCVELGGATSQLSLDVKHNSR
jgi:predicted deacylase